MPRRTRPLIIAEAVGWDFADMRDQLYQPGHTPVPIYTIGDDYLTVVSPSERAKLVAWWEARSGDAAQIVDHPDDRAQRFAAEMNPPRRVVVIRS